MLPEKTLEQALAALQAGNVVGFPTETVFGLAADAASEMAIDAIYALKGRDRSVPLQIMVPDVATARQIAQFTPLAERLAKAFWPGGLTLILERAAHSPVHPGVNTQNTTLGLRVPDHPTAQALLTKFGRPLATTSANRSGEPSAKNAAEARAIFGNAVSCILPDADAPHGTASTVIDVTGPVMRILRHGAISEAQIRSILNQ